MRHDHLIIEDYLKIPGLRCDVSEPAAFEYFLTQELNDMKERVKRQHTAGLHMHELNRVAMATIDFLRTRWSILELTSIVGNVDREFRPVFTFNYEVRKNHGILPHDDFESDLEICLNARLEGLKCDDRNFEKPRVHRAYEAMKSFTIICEHKKTR